MSSSIPLQEWLAALTRSARELVTTTLGFEQFEVVEKQETTSSETKYGSFVELLNAEVKVTIGIVTDRMGSQKITESLLGMQPMAEEDEADALGEVVNILAGNTKTYMRDRIKSMQLGLPFYFRGMVHFKEPVTIASNFEKWGPVEVTVMIIQRTDK